MVFFFCEVLFLKYFYLFQYNFVYLFLNLGYDPISALYVLMTGSTLVILIDMIILKLNMKEFSLKIFFYQVMCKSALLISIPTFLAYVVHNTHMNEFAKLILVCITYWVIILPIIYHFGISREIRNKIKDVVKRKLAVCK